MYIRCSDCLASTWTEILGPDGPVEAFECAECGRRHVLSPIEDLGTSVRDHYRRALSFGNDQNLDMSSAYSVLLGIMSREQAEILSHSRMPEPEPPDEQDVELGLVDPIPSLEDSSRAEAPSGSAARPKARLADRLPLVPDFDLGFTKAIASGDMTVQEAMTRGNRDAFAERLMHRHRLCETLAYRVTDNRVTLRAALKEQEERREAAREARERAKGAGVGKSEPETPTASRLLTLLVLGAAAVLVSAVIWSTWSRFTADRQPVLNASVTSPLASTHGGDPATAPGEGGEALQAATEVVTDDLGRVTHVVGPDPTSVLVAYCEASSSLLGLAPIEIASTVPRFRDARLGVFRDYAALETAYAIRIRKDVRTGRWSTGGFGTTPVPVAEAPDFPLDAVRIPVSGK